MHRVYEGMIECKHEKCDTAWYRVTVARRHETFIAAPPVIEMEQSENR